MARICPRAAVPRTCCHGQRGSAPLQVVPEMACSPKPLSGWGFLSACASPPPVPLLWELAPTGRGGQAGLSQLHPLGRWLPGHPGLSSLPAPQSWKMPAAHAQEHRHPCILAPCCPDRPELGQRPPELRGEQLPLGGSQKPVALQSCIQNVGCSHWGGDCCHQNSGLGAGGDGVEMPGGVNSQPSASGTPARPPNGHREWPTVRRPLQPGAPLSLTVPRAWPGGQMAVTECQLGCWTLLSLPLLTWPLRPAAPVPLGTC